MKLKEFIDTIASHEATLSVVLPTGDEVPANFHITDVGVVTHDMIDCGGQLATTYHVQAQLWLGEDSEHRMSCNTLSGILKASQSIFDKFADIDSADIHVEYQLDNTISKYMVESIDAGYCGVSIRLSNIHTVCLELERNPDSNTCGNNASSCC